MKCMNNSNRDDFQSMLQLAEFAARRHDERRQVEFRVFIAYITLLALAFYQTDKIVSRKEPYWVVAGVLLIHAVYLLWQIRLSTALVNDAWRRNFYLKKAECLGHHLSKHPNVPFSPRRNVSVTLTMGPEVDETSECPERGKIYEKELFDRHEPKIILVSRMLDIWKHWRQIVTDWSRLFETLIPTLMLPLIMLKLVSKGLTLLLTLTLVAVVAILISLDILFSKRKRHPPRT